ncbi:MAG: hypothetical protein MR510_04045 [Clostridium sp.]|uniref:hypothetical protein n=1 Tax=Clostridium sp. TaxID=1506 RepID=UPI0025E031ED|nr:hypothetical protein [Clostridium sp.]MCI6691651.1 hypothetical protein [Clostridium sp.]MDY2631035.1 hypothetical protein [Clostridium sp.]
MRKPSIFSRDYERLMRKRRKRIAIISILGVLVIGILFLKMAMNSINMETLRSKVQSWIDEDNEEIQDNTNKTNEENKQEETVQEETPKEPEIKTMDLIVREGIILKAEYEESNGVVKFKGIKDAPSNIYYTLNQDKNLILTIDENQDMKIFNVNTKEANITKDKYVAPNGEVFNKSSVLQTYNGYLWNVEAKFITNTKVAYISNVPYFGYDLNKYIWVVDLNDNSHKTLWNSKGKEIKLGEIKEKGLEVTIDGNVKYINSNGELIN